MLLFMIVCFMMVGVFNIIGWVRFMGMVVGILVLGFNWIIS